MKKTLLLSIILFCTQLATAQSPIQVEKAGEGNPILFLPGFATPGSVWSETIEHLEVSHESHWVTYAGFDEVPPIEMPWYPALTTALIEYIENENLSNLTIIGHSMGGNLAVELAAQLGEKVTGLILVDSIPCMRELMMPGVPVSAIQYKSPYNDQMLAMSDDEFAGTATMMAANMASEQDDIDQLTQWVLEADRETYVYGYTDLLKLDLRPMLKDISVPTLILGATFPTKDVAQQTFENQYENLENKSISMAEVSKHFIMLDQPEWFYSEVNAYLATNGQ